MMNQCVQLGLLLLLVLVCLYFGVPTIIDYIPAAKYDELPIPYQSSQQVHTVSATTARSSRTKHDTVGTGKIKISLPQLVIDHIKTFVFFLGHAHSGHSIVGSLLDGHLHMVISHEADVFTKLSNRMLSPTKQDVFNAVWQNTMQTIINGHRAKHVKGYDLLVDGLYQGKYVDHIDVIGDKKGQATADLLLTQPEKWSGAYNILKSFNVTLKVIQVFRNPYDIIATTILLNRNLKQTFASIKQTNITRRVSPSLISHQIKNYFLRHNAIVNAKKKYNLDLIEVHGKDLISDPRGTLLKLCNHLGVNCSNNYLEICSNKIFKTESRTRRLIKWTDEQIKMIQQNIDKYSNLKGYSFDSL